MSDEARMGLSWSWGGVGARAMTGARAVTGARDGAGARAVTGD